MPITPLAKALKMPIKAWARRHGITPSQISIQSSAGKVGYITVMIDRHLEFPLEERIRALKIIYPKNESCWSGSAGNIRSNMMTMIPSQWERFVTDIGIQVENMA